MKWFVLLLCALLLLPMLAAADVQTYSGEDAAALEAQFKEVTLTKGLKNYGQDMPVMTQRLGADPWALVYGDRVYLYMTGDVLEKDVYGKINSNSYSKINRLHVVSSADLVNWTDHGWIAAAGLNGACKWGNNSWAPTAAVKNIDGEDHVFIYFANGGNGIGVIEGPGPLGPFTDPLGHALIDRRTPNCSNVTWLFDPAVLVDDDGAAYIYFGGGIPKGREADPGTARVARLGDDMISLAETPVKLDVPYLFEDSGINKLGDTYIYSYCTNWNVPASATKDLGIENAQIAYMTADNPYGPFMLKTVILKNPGTYFGCYGNNHHSMFKFKDNWYIAWHTQILEKAMGVSGGYRATGITQLNVNEEVPYISQVRSATRNGLQACGTLDPYEWVEAETIAAMGGITTKPADPNNTTGNMIVSTIDRGDWISVYNADFGGGAKQFRVVARGDEGAVCTIQLRLNGPFGDIVGYVTLEGTGDWQETTAELIAPVEDVNNLVMIFDNTGFELDKWQFVHEN